MSSTTDFTAKRHGFHFPNDFVNPVMNIPGFGTITTEGLCGGMTFSSLDYYHATTPIPTHVKTDFPGGSTVPPPGSRFYKQIFDRQLDTFNPLNNPDIVKFITMPIPVGRSAFEVSMQDEWPRITAKLDAGEPSPLGLLADSANPTQGHQVVATGYTDSPQSIQIYDSNHPDRTVTLTPDSATSLVRASTGENWIGFFLETYTQASPGYSDLVLSTGIDTNPVAPAVAALGDIVETGFTVRNNGDYTAHLKSLDAALIGPSGEDLDNTYPVDGIAANLAPGGTQSYLAQPVVSFGTTAGTYEFIAYYQSTLNEWFVVPAGAPGTQTATTLEAQ